LPLKVQLVEKKLAFSNPKHGLDAGDSRGRTLESLESQHRADPQLHSPVVLFDQVTQLLR
jgi:hypothetical protein